MRWQGQIAGTERTDALPGMSRLDEFVRSVRTPEFAGVTFHEVLAKSALNHVPGSSRRMPLVWTINPYRGCQHACRYCFARPTHTYLDLDEGEDFDREIVVKINVVETLERELRRPPSGLDAVALGTNTDPYQRAEGRYALMPGIIDALTRAGVPFSVLTKGTLVRRDLERLAASARRVPVSLAMSIAVYDDALQRSIEPGTPSVQARLDTVRAAKEAGLPVSVFVMPVLPYLTDDTASLDRALERVAAAGADSALYTALHLRPGVKQWFLGWLERERPDLVPRYRALYRGGAYAPSEYRSELAARVRPLLRKHRLDRPAPQLRRRAEAATTELAAPQPTLF